MKGEGEQSCEDLGLGWSARQSAEQTPGSRCGVCLSTRKASVAAVEVAGDSRRRDRGLAESCWALGTGLRAGTLFCMQRTPLEGSKQGNMRCDSEL